MAHDIKLELLVFINQLFYCIAAIPQVIENYRNKSTRALSDIYIFAVFNTYALLLFYMFCLNQPLGYKVSISFQFLVTIITALQRFYYSSWDSLTRKLVLSALINSVMLILLIPYAYAYPLYVGNVSGWVVLGLGLVNRLPQMLKFYEEKSVKGFSLGFILFSLIASCMELFIILTYGLPLQTLCIVIWSLFSTLILTYQYWRYHA